MTQPTVHPGKVLLEELLERDWTLTGLAADLQIERDHLRDLLLGLDTMTDELAVKVGQLTGSGAEFWNNLQHNYDAANSEPVTSEAKS